MSAIVTNSTKIYWIVLAYGLLLASVCLLTDFNGLYGQDSYEYLRFASALKNYFETGQSPGFFFWPIGYPSIGAIISLIIRVDEISMLGISILFSLVTLFFTFKTGELLFPENNKSLRLFLVLFLCFSPFIFRASIVVMSDMMALGCISGSYYYACLYWRFHKPYSFLTFILFCALSCTTRYVSFVILLIPAILLFLKLFQKKQYLLLFPATLIVIVVFTPHFILRQETALSFLKHDGLGLWSVTNFFKNEFITAEGARHYGVINLLFVFSNFVYPGYLFAGIIFVLFLKKEMLTSTAAKIILISIFFYAFFIAGIQTQNQRFLLLTFPLILLVFFPAFIRITEVKQVQKYSVVLIVLILFIQVSLITRALLPFIRLNKTEKGIALSVKKYSSHKIIYTSGTEGLLNFYGAPQKRISLFDKKITTYKSNSLILLNPTEIEQQWKGKNPDFNWTYIKQNLKVVKLETLPVGWELYEIR